MAFQKDSDLACVFNYHIHKMQARGIFDRFWSEVERKQNMNKDDTKVQNVNVVGYENVTFPFMALLTGLLAALLQLGIEFTVFSKKKYPDDNAIQSNDVHSNHSEASELILAIKEVSDMLVENNSNQKVAKLQSTIKEAREIMEKIKRLLQETNSRLN